MRYRMEMIEDELVIRNVETDIKLGSAVPLGMDDPRDPGRLIVSACTVLNKDGYEIATISKSTVSNPLEQAAVAVANHEAACGYPGFKVGAKNPDPHSTEWRLGTLLADTAYELERASIEYLNGGLKGETKSKCTELIAQLWAIWYASRFGSFDGERRVMEPYFANFGGEPRMSFAAAARHYGMLELRMRFPDVSEALLKKVLSWPLELLTHTLNRLSPK